MLLNTFKLTAVAWALAACSSGSSDNSGSDNDGDTGTVIDPVTPVFDSVETASNITIGLSKTAFYAQNPNSDGRSTRSFTRSLANGRGGYDLDLAMYLDDESNSASFIANAGIREDTLVAAGPDTGVLTYNAGYVVLEVTDALNTDTIVTQDVVTSGAIMISADFAQNTISGTSDLLTLDGTLADSGTGFTGDVTWRGVAGEAEGLVGRNEILGAFAGSDDNAVFAGAITGEVVE